MAYAALAMGAGEFFLISTTATSSSGTCLIILPHWMSASHTADHIKILPQVLMATFLTTHDATASVASFATLFAANFIHHFASHLITVPPMPKVKTSKTPVHKPIHHLIHLSVVVILLPLRSTPRIAIPIS